MATTHELSRDTWGRYFDDLCQHGHAHTVRMEVASTQLGDQHLAEGVPLEGIALEAQDTISVTVGRPGELFTHRIPGAQRVVVAEDDDGEPTCVDIESGEQGKTLLYFSPQDNAYGGP